MSVPTTAIARYEPVLSDIERMTMLGFLAGYRADTRDADALDVRDFTAWCWQVSASLATAKIAARPEPPSPGAILVGAGR